MSFGRTHALLAAILLIYLVLGVLFAVSTPRWEAPDEPAHYNYVRYLVENGRFPVLQMGDYPHEYLEEIKGRRFPPDLSIDPIRYEYHQPPLYYLLAAPIYLLGKGNLLPLRLLSVALGAGVVILAFATAQRIFPDWPALALATAAFVAFLPQHLATVSQAGNDVLAELLFALVLFQLVGWLQNQESKIVDRKSAIVLGFLLGLILITKTTAYIAVPLALAVLVWRWFHDRAPARGILADLALIGAPAAIIALPWYARDVATYGWPDFLGLRRHDAIVIGQMRLHEYLVQFGWSSYLRRLVEFTFKSFWGVFGWLGVFMDSRIYLAVAILCGVAIGGLALRVTHYVPSPWLRPGFRRRPLSEGPSTTQHAPRTPPSANVNRKSEIVNQKPALWLLVATFLLTLLVYAWYNRQFVQHQGRYLFTALIPVAIFFALGWDEALRPRSSLLLAFGLVAAAIALAIWGVTIGPGLPKWPLALIFIFAVLMALASSIRAVPVPERDRNNQASIPRARATADVSISRDPGTIRGVLFALPYALLPMLSLYALFGAIVPQLAS